MIAGSGFFGAVIAERIARVLELPVVIIEKRDHIGGNCFSRIDEKTGIEFHKYGTHIFHTSNSVVWNYISNFTTFNSYRHQVLSSYKDKVYQLPINLETINSFYQVNLKPYEIDRFLDSKRKKIASPSNFEEKALSVIGKDLYEAFIKGYTLKQWQIHPRELPAAIFDRIPFRKNYDESYYHSRWQGIPEEGYGALFSKLLADRKISILLNTDFFDVRGKLNPDAQIIYSGPIDKFFDYKYRKLSWRTLRFQNEIVGVEDYQGSAVINYPEEDIPFTRIHEPRHLHPERFYSKDQTLIVREYSQLSNGNDPYYPIATKENNRKYELYRQEAERLTKVHIGGRLGEYKYLDMDKTIERALQIFETRILPQFATENKNKHNEKKHLHTNSFL